MAQPLDVALGQAGNRCRHDPPLYVILVGAAYIVAEVPELPNQVARGKLPQGRRAQDFVAGRVRLVTGRALRLIKGVAARVDGLGGNQEATNVHDRGQEFHSPMRCRGFGAPGTW
jgi:hypothetical protein